LTNMGFSPFPLLLTYFGNLELFSYLHVFDIQPPL